MAIRVKVETKITVLDGAEKDRVFIDERIMDTNTEINSFGIVERLRWEWNYIHHFGAKMESEEQA